MGIQIRSGFTAAAVRVAQARAEYLALLQAEALSIAVEAEHLAREGTLAGVYSTPEGKYKRSEKLLESIYSRPVLANKSVGIEVGNTAPYASFVEFGTRGGYISPEEAASLAEAQPGLGVLYLGRTGLNWQAPNPAVTRSSVVAGHLLQKASSSALKTALGRQS